MANWLDTKKVESMVRFYRANPSIAAYDLLGVDLYGVQRVLLEAMWFRNFIIIIATRGAGKTYLQAVFAALTAMLYPGHRIGFVSASFRQAKFMFQELERLYDRCPILREACAKEPVHGSDSFYLSFKNPAGYQKPGSHIEAVPLGKGDKIRGARFHTICADEMGSIPSDIFKMVIKPMAATTADPMFNVRRKQREDRLLAEGLITDDERTANSDNRIIMTSSGNFKFNHLYTIYKEYREQMDAGNKKYFAARVPYNILPPNFLSEAIIEDSKNLSSFEFKMEYEAGFISDSDGVFRASLLTKQTSTNQSVEVTGESGCKYIMIVDPAREETAATAIVIVKLVPGIGGFIVYAHELFSTPFPDQARFLKNLCRKFTVAGLFMDQGGGGKAIRDLFYEKRDSSDFAIIDKEDPNITREGLRILHMINFSPEWITDANYRTLSLLEKGKLWFPAPILNGSEEKEHMHFLIEKTMKSQILSVTITQTRTGKLHFDTPTASQSKGVLSKARKDLYSCFIMAGHALYEDLGFAADSSEAPNDPILIGIVKPVSNRGGRNAGPGYKVPDHFKERFNKGRYFK